MKIVILQECSAGNESVGNEWVETGIFEDTQTLAEVLEWRKQLGRGEQGRLMITVPKQILKKEE